MLAKQTQILLCTVHAFSKEHPQMHFAIHLFIYLFLSKVKLHCLEMSGFKPPVIVL